MAARASTATFCVRARVGAADELAGANDGDTKGWHDGAPPNNGGGGGGAVSYGVCVCVRARAHTPSDVGGDDGGN